MLQLRKLVNLFVVACVCVCVGTWLTIFEIMSTACVLTNCGLVFFTSTIFSRLTLFQRMVRRPPPNPF